MRLLATLAALALLVAGSTTTLRAEEVALASDDEKVLYALGMMISRNLSTFSFSEQELAAVQAGLIDGALGRDSRVPLDTFAPRIDAMLQGRMQKMIDEEKKEGAAFRATLAQEEGASTTDSGLIYSVIESGSGASPGPADTVKIHYKGTLRDGSVFDTSLKGPGSEPVKFSLNGVIPCFAEGVGKMNVGGKSKLVCAPEI
ncbi:MAG: FKBP-type peptidyl-prolyl cis-trans isomerase, partial [Acidobacteriota bacterium]|nr:FKBP-type peptidyl-prolyl cis-trans isomerase [Acidobacteriota bacterium]